MRRWRIGLIGTGKHGSRYAQHLVADLAPHAQLTAISRRSPTEGQAQARAWAAAYHQDWRDLIADPTVDAVIGVTTPNLNPAIARLCLEHGKPLLLEKPLATTLAAAQEMVEAFHATGLPLTVGQTLRYNSVILALRRELPRVGKLHGFSASHHLEPSTLPWLTDPEPAGGGVILHTAVHVFDALRFITQEEVLRVRASAFQIHNPNLEDLLSAQLEMSGGVVGVLMAGKVGAARAGRYEFLGEEGQVQGDQVHGGLELVRGMAISPLPCPAPGPTILPLLRDWLDFLSGSRDNPIPGREGMAAVRICEACRRSVASGDWVRL